MSSSQSRNWPSSAGRKTTTAAKIAMGSRRCRSLTRTSTMLELERSVRALAGPRRRETLAHALLEARGFGRIVELPGERVDEMAQIARGRAVLADHETRNRPEILDELGLEDGAASGKRLVE